MSNLDDETLSIYIAFKWIMDREPAEKIKTLFNDKVTPNSRVVADGVEDKPTLFEVACVCKRNDLAKMMIDINGGVLPDISMDIIRRCFVVVNKELLQIVFDAIPDMREYERTKNDCYLAFAIAAEEYDIAQQLIDKNVSLEVQTSQGNPPLTVLLLKDNYPESLLDNMLRHGANVGVVPAFFASTPLLVAIFGGRTEVLHKLLVMGDGNIPQDVLDAALCLTAEDGRVEMSKLLLYYGADKNSDMDGEPSPVTRAQRHNRTEIIELFDNHPFPLQCTLQLDQERDRIKAHLSPSDDVPNAKRTRLE